MITPRSRTCIVLTAMLVAVSLQLQARQLPLLTFSPGDILVSLEPGPVQWYSAGGLIRRVLAQTSPGTGEGMALDRNRNLYVTRWCIDPFCQQGDTGSVEKYDNLGSSQGKTGPVFNCSPHTIVFDAAGAAYVGQAGCRKTILKYLPGETVATEYTVAEDAFGVFWMDLAPDGCTMFYTSFGANVKRYDVCRGAQLRDFNDEPLPGAVAQDLRVLSDGGVLVASGQVIARLNGSGVVTQTYEVPGEGALWVGLDLVGDGTFWVGNYYTSNVYRFNLTTGAQLASFNSGTPANTVVGIRVVK